MRVRTATGTEAELKEQSLGRRPNQQQAPSNLQGQRKTPSEQKTSFQAALFSLCEEKGVESDASCRLFWIFTSLQADNSLHHTEKFPSHLVSILKPKPALLHGTLRGTAAPALSSPGGAAGPSGAHSLSFLHSTAAGPGTYRQKTCSHCPRDTGSRRTPALWAEQGETRHF